MPSLYRKWRSGSFDDLYGQDHVVRTLRNAVRQGRLGHAYLFTGPRGTGKTSTARILAKAVNCLNPRDGNPCNECEMCVAANEGRALDVIEIDAASNTSVENVRDLRERVAYAAGEGRWKVYIIDEVHRLSAAAFDAFLKTLEEPPPHVIFVFASTEPHKVPATIMSRCQRFDFRRISPEVAQSRLREVADAELLAVDDAALQIIAQNAAGSMRDALGLLDQVASYTQGEIGETDVRAALGLADPELVARLTDALIDGALGTGLGALGDFVDKGGDPGQLARQFVDYWRALLLCSSGVSRNVEVDPALATQLSSHAQRLPSTHITAVLQAITRQEVSAKFSVPAELPFEIGYAEAHAILRRSAPVAAPVPQRSEPPSAPPALQAPAAEEHRTEQPVSPPAAAAAEAPEQVLAVQGPPSDVEQAWHAVVAGMRSRSPSLQAVLRSGHLLNVQDGEITVGFLHTFHRDQFADVRKRRILEEVVGEVMGASYRVTCVRTSKEEIESLKGEGALGEDDGFVEEVAERLREYHARQIGNGAS